MNLINLLFLTFCFVGLAELADGQKKCDKKSGCFDKSAYCDCLRRRRALEPKVLNGTAVKIVFIIR